MFCQVRLFAARALFAFAVAMSIGFGLMIAGVASFLAVLTTAAFRIATIRVHWVAGQGSPEAMRTAAPNVAAQPA